MIKPLSSYDLDSVVTVDNALDLIRKNLQELTAMLSDSPPLSSQDKTQMVANLDFIKRYYERTEQILIGTST